MDTDCENTYNIQHLNTLEDLDTIIEKYSGTKKYFCLDFYADWCQPCRMISPLFEHLSYTSRDSHILCCKINIEESDELASFFTIRSLPTFLLIDQQKNIVKECIGADERVLQHFFV